MSFEIDTETLMISGYKGDSASFIFEFDKDIANYDVTFLVKKHLNDNEENAVIKKTITSPQRADIEVNVTSVDTNKLGMTGYGFKDYYWSLKLKSSDNTVETVIPNDFLTVPIFRVYP